MTEIIREGNYLKAAHRQALPLKLALFGPSKSGKTLTGLKIIRGVLGEGVPFAVIDTENRGTEEYQGDPDVGEFDIAALHTNFAADRFVKLLTDVIGFGYTGVLVDGISPLWEGPGGIQAVADANNSGNKKFGGWDVANAEHQKVLRAIVECPVHLICTMRSKTAYVVGEDGKTRKVGLKPVQRDGIEYEFRLLGEMDSENNVKITGRRGFQNRVVQKPGADLAKELRHYLGSVEAHTDEANAAREAQDRAAEETPEELKERVQAAEQLAAGVATPPPTATTVPPETGTTPPVTPATDSAPASVAVGSVSMTDPGGKVMDMPAVSVASLLAAGWTVTPQPSPVTPAAPVADIAPATETPEPAAPSENVSTPTATGPTEPSSPVTAETTPPASTNGDPSAKMESGQLQKIVELCQELATIKPDKGDASWWMDWANRKAMEEYHHDFGTMTRDQASGLIERIEKTKLALKES